MVKRFFAKYGRAFAEILFICPRPDSLRQMNVIAQIVLYAAAFAFFGLPILYFVVRECIRRPALIAFFAAMALIHVAAKAMLCNSKRIQHRFSTMKREKHFLLRTRLIAEYIVFMWLVYLFYPLACILFPALLWGMSIESLLNYSVIFDFFSQYPEQLISYGSILSYILFILADGYKKLKAGFLPDYLGLYVVLTALSSTVEGLTGNLLGQLNIDASSVSKILSQIIMLSNDSMNIVASAMSVFFALFFLYTAHGADPAENAEGPREAPVEEHR
jgi:hypothetical protein